MLESFKKGLGSVGDKIERKLAIIFVSDVVDFSIMMKRNEDATLKSLRACIKILEGLLDENDGRIFNTAGDSVLAEFQSAVSAVICATEFQKLVKQRNQNVSDDSKMQFRVGLNIGDVIVEGSNLYGDGVNVAARLEALSLTGGVSMSKSIHDLVSQKVEFSFKDLGEQTIKNTTVHAYDITMDGVSERVIASSQAISLVVESKPPAIAVLPFKNMSADEDQEYFADGVTEDIISALSTWKTFPVISRNSSFSMKGQNLASVEIASQLGARYLVEGSIRKGGNKVRITASLNDAETGQQIWSKRWDRLLEDIFDVQDEVSQEIAVIVEPTLKGQEQKKLSYKTSVFGAWDKYLQALSAFYKAADYVTVHALCDAAIALDANICDPYVLKCKILYLRIFDPNFDSERAANEKDFHALSRKAYTLDQGNPDAVVMLSRSFNLTKELDQRIAYAEKALNLNPSHAAANYDYGLAISNEGKATQALDYVYRAIELNPAEHQEYEFMLPVLYMAAADSGKAGYWIEKLYQRSGHNRYLGWAAAVEANLGNLKVASQKLKAFLELRPEIKSMQDYEAVTPEIIKHYVMPGLKSIWPS